MTVVRFSGNDVIATSSPVKTITWTGLEDKVSNNNYASFDGNDYLIQSSTSAEFKTFKSDLANYFEDPSLANAGNGAITFGSYTLNSFIGSQSVRDGADGKYVYQGNNKFVKQ